MGKSFIWGAVSVLAALLIGALVSYFVCKARFEAILDTFTPEVVVEYRTDTLRLTETKYVASKPIHDSIPVYIHDTTLFVRADTLFLPKEQKEYADSCYRAWVSGISPNLDSIYVFPKTTIITKTTPVPVKQRLNVGLQGGVGAVQPFAEKFEPKVGYYLGLGLQYNF